MAEQSTDYLHYTGRIGGRDTIYRTDPASAERLLTELLAACQAAVDRLDYLRGLWGDEAVTRRLADQLRTAVARATGQPAD